MIQEIPSTETLGVSKRLIRFLGPENHEIPETMVTSTALPIGGENVTMHRPGVVQAQTLKRASADEDTRLLVMPDAKHPDVQKMAQDLKKYEFNPREVIVRLRPEMTFEAFSKICRQSTGFSIKSRCSFFGKTSLLAGEILVLSLPENISVAQAIVGLNKDTRLQYAEPNYTLRLNPVEPRPYQSPNQECIKDLATTNDPKKDKLWGLDNQGQTGGTRDADIDAPEAWDIGTGGSDQILAVIDTGIDYNHEDLKDNIWVNQKEIVGNGVDDDNNGFVDDIHGANLITGSGNPMDDQSHGTHVAGTIGAVGNNGKGVVGVNHKARIMALKFLGADGSGSTEDAIKAFMYAKMMGARVTSNSWGGGGLSKALKDAMAADQNCLHVCAAGNGGPDGIGDNNDSTPHYPSSYSKDLANVISVAATDHNDRLARFSNYGKTVDIAAPGLNIYSTLPNGNYGNMSGTSMATPHVSGVAYLYLSRQAQATAAEIKRRLKDTADRVDSLTNRVASGRLNAHKALQGT